MGSRHAPGLPHSRARLARRDAEHIEADMHRLRGRARDESPEVRAGVRRKFRVAERYYA